MKQKSIVIGCYATLIFIGGLIGYLVAHSVISLIVSALFTLLLFGCSIFVWKEHLPAYYTTIAIVFCLCAFFCYRFFLTYKLAPAGIMTLISIGLFIYLTAFRKQLSRIAR